MFWMFCNFLVNWESFLLLFAFPLFFRWGGGVSVSLGTLEHTDIRDANKKFDIGEIANFTFLTG